LLLSLTSEQAMTFEKKKTNSVFHLNFFFLLFQAMMELGALVCTPKNPDCSKCPLKSCCSAVAEVELFTNKAKEKLLSSSSSNQEDDTSVSSVDSVKHKNNRVAKSEDIENCADNLTLPNWNPALGVENYPQKFNKKTPRTEKKIVIIIELCEKNEYTGTSQVEIWLKNQSKILVSQRSKSGLLANLWEFPNEDIEKIYLPSKKRKHSHLLSSDASNIDLEAVTKFASKILSVVELNSYTNLHCHYSGEYLHKFSHIHQTSYVFAYKIIADIKIADVVIPAGLNYRWVNYVEFEKLAKPTLTMNIFKLFSQKSMTLIKGKNRQKSVSKNKQASIKSFFQK